MSDPLLDIQTISQFLCSSLLDQLYAKVVYLCSFVTKFSQTYTIYIHLNAFNCFYRGPHTWKVPQNPHNSPPPTPAPFKQRFPKFHCRTFSICCLHMFSSLESSYSLFEGLLSFGWPKDKRSSNRFWIDSPQVSFPFQRKFHPFSHTDTPSPKCAYSFSRSRCSSLNSVRAWTVLFIKNLFS